LAQQLREGSATHNLVLCIPPMQKDTSEKELEHLRRSLSFLMSINWKFVVDLSGLVNAADEAVPLFPTACKWAVCQSPADIVSDEVIPLFLGIAALPLGAFEEVATFIPGVCLSPNESDYGEMGKFLAIVEMNSGVPPAVLTDSLALLKQFAQMVRKHAKNSIVAAFTPEDICNHVCNMSLLSVLCAPPQRHVLLRSSTVSGEKKVSVPVDYWSIPRSELLHLHCGHLEPSHAELEGEADAAVDDEETMNLDVSADDEVERAEREDAEEQAALRVRYEAHAEKQRRKLASAFYLDNTEANWALYGQVVKPTRQLEAVARCFCIGKLKSYTLQHAYGAGGSTFMRHLLYMLRESFACIVITGFDGGTRNFSDLRSALRDLHDLTGGDVAVLVDLGREAEYEGTVKTSLIANLKKMAFVRLLVCEHYDLNSAPPSGGQHDADDGTPSHGFSGRKDWTCRMRRISLLSVFLKNALPRALLSSTTAVLRAVNSNFPSKMTLPRLRASRLIISYATVCLIHAASLAKLKKPAIGLAGSQI
jgi:hypothetical protein